MRGSAITTNELIDCADFSIVLEASADDVKPALASVAANPRIFFLLFFWLHWDTDHMTSSAACLVRITPIILFFNLGCHVHC
jgi:hypothetical protein